MPQQINLFTSIQLGKKLYFSADIMVQALAIFVVLGGGVCAYSVSRLNITSENLRKSLPTQLHELQSLQSALQQYKTDKGPIKAAMLQELQDRRAELLQRKKLMGELQRGVFQPGSGHAARLQLVAQSIPAPVWVTEMMADDSQLAISGFTRETAALNDWVGKLAASPLLKKQKLATIKVENASATMPTASGPVWSFSLVSAVEKPSTTAADKP